MKDSILQPSGLSDMLLSYFHPDKNILSVSSSYPYPIHSCTPSDMLTHAFTHALVCLCIHSKHSDVPGFLHVLFTPVILPRTAMETEFSIQISSLFGGMCVSVSDLKLLFFVFFSSSRHGSISFNQSLCSHYFH